MVGGGESETFFITSLRCPSELSLVLHNWMLRMSLVCVYSASLFHAIAPATQMQPVSNNLSPRRWPPDSIMSFINLYLFHKCTRVRGIHVCLSAGM